jgi:hypothetical protein
MLNSETTAYSTVTWYLCTAKLADQSREALFDHELMNTGPVDAAIAEVFGDTPFLSVRKLLELA